MLLPFIFFLSRPIDGGQWEYHDLAGSFGFLILFCFMAFSVLIMGAVFQQKVENRLREFLA
jgi:hypothetical protein